MATENIQENRVKTQEKSPENEVQQEEGISLYLWRAGENRLEAEEDKKKLRGCDICRELQLPSAATAPSTIAPTIAQSKLARQIEIIKKLREHERYNKIEIYNP